MKDIDKKIKLSNITIELLDMIRTVLICIVCVFIFTTIFFKPVKVEGDSMKPTLLDGEYGFSNVFSILNEDYNRFDIVVVKHKEDESLWVKRIIGLPGDTVEYKDEKLYINGEYVEETFLDENYIKQQTSDGLVMFTYDFGPVTLGEDEVFLVGDNRLVSHDSRSVGAFKTSDLVSKSVFVYFPFNRMGIVNNGTK